MLELPALSRVLPFGGYVAINYVPSAACLARAARFPGTALLTIIAKITFQAKIG
jgi:hypothetical protein